MSPEPRIPAGRGERVAFRPATEADIEPTWAYRRLPEVTEWLPHHPATRADYATRFVESPRLERTLVLEAGGEVVGDLYLHVHDAGAQAEVAGRAAGAEAEIGWVLHPDHAGRGYATEGVEALLRMLFEAWGLRRVTASCFADNAASWRLMERVGMRREARHVAAELHRTRGWCDGLTYAILAEEWRARS